MTAPSLPMPAGADRRSRVEPIDSVTLVELMDPALARWKTVLMCGLLGAATGLAATFAIPPSFTATTTFLPPQQQQNSSASALASLGVLAGLAGAGPVRTPADQYASLLQSETVRDRIIDAFGLIRIYDADYRVDARKELARNVTVGVGKKDGLLTVEVTDHSPQRAAAIANRFVDELRVLTSKLALTEAQQRRVFFEGQMSQTRDRLTRAQRELQSSGFGLGALRSEPKAAAESYARLRAEATAAEVRLQTLRRNLTDAAPEVAQTLSTLGALRAQIGKLEVDAPAERAGDPDYVSKYREYKYEESLFEIFARQFELARLDESKDGALIQVVDPALAPELKSKPRRGLFAAAAGAISLLAACVWLISVPLRRRNSVPTAATESI